MCAFHAVPAVVGAADAVWQYVDLLPCILADVGDKQVTGGAVEAEAPRVAQAIRPDLWSGVSAVAEWVVVWRGVGLGDVDVEAQQLAEESAQVLTVSLRVVGAAPIAQSDV